MLALGDASLKDASSPAIFQRGKAYATSGSVEVVAEDPLPEPALRTEVIRGRLSPRSLKWYQYSDVSLIHPRIHNMPASGTSTQRTQALALLKQQGMTRLAEFSEAAITATTVGRMERAGEVVRLARGLYQLPDAALDAQQALAEAARLVPKGVICLASALAFHGLTDQVPPKV